MRPLFWIGLVVLVLGIAAFIVPVPRQERHGVKVADTNIGVETTSRERLPLWVGGALVVVGGVIVIAGGRKA
jgi:hypothetical protein